MGNQHSTGGNRRSQRRAALSQSCESSGLYESCAWEQRTIRRLIKGRKLAARLKGKDDRETGREQKCPICILHYDDINMMKCCKATICTECYLQVQDPENRDSPCPFCKKSRMAIVVAKKLGVDDADKRAFEEQKVIEATIRARKNSEPTAAQTSLTSANTNAVEPNLTEERYERHEQLRDTSLNDLLNDQQYERHEQLSEISLNDQQYEGLERINESNISSSRNTNVPSDNDMNFLHSAAQHLNIDYNSDLRTATEIFLAEISEASQLELAIQLSLMEAENPEEHEAFVY